MIKVYMMNVTAIELNEASYSTLSQRRIEKVKKIKKDIPKKQSIAAEQLLNIAVDKEYNNVYHPVQWDTDEYGKPYLVDYPNLQINITHSRDYAVCVASDMHIGVDIQYMRDVDLKISERFFTDEESKYIMNAPNPKEAFYEMWVRKESLVKAVGKGLSIPLNSFSVMSEYVEYENVKYKLKMCKTADSDYKMCICIEQ